MTQVSIYNTSLTPAVIGDGRVVGGMEWATVSEEEAAPHIESGVFIYADVFVYPGEAPSEEREEVTEVQENEGAPEDSFIDDVDVSSDSDEEIQDDDESYADEVQSVEEQEIVPTPATIRRSRRRQMPQDKE